ncbi:phenylalanine--tRNA ligase subunit beta [Candidatus Gracilibacteria bacterium]|nr:phenylalanine--tRNA ligase subunit beta [Candidatus Gracilibacteria bacterium]
MRYSEILLKKFISVDDSPENIADKLILKTCEIEEIENRKISDSIVIGYVNKCYKHPDADKLNVCEVDCGDEGEYQIICGGSNVREGIFVPTALPGTVFEKAGITIEKRNMRGIESNGMICSKQELGINEDIELHSIRDLVEDFDDVNEKDLGIALNKKYPWLESYTFDVDNKGLTNRPDLTGHFGTAIELNAMYSEIGNVKGKMGNEKISFNKIKDYMKQFTDQNIFEILDNSKKSERKVIGESDSLNTYILLELNNIQIKKSDFFTRLQMIDLGSNPINNRVDFSNLFMNISGQPIHFFDATKVDGDIIIRNANDGEKFVDLFEKEHELKSSDLVIADKKKILALAGVVGGLDSGVNENTKNIIVEIANFDPVSVRKTGTRLGLRTDAELRYEKNINPLFSLYCLILFLDELKYYSKDLGSFDMGGLDYYISNKLKEKSKKLKEVKIDYKKMEKFIFGKEIENFENDAKKVLEGLGFIVNQDNLVVPIWRSPDDINISEDIYEEVARIYGYETIENSPLMTEVNNVEYSGYVGLQRKLEDIAVKNLNFDQVETYPWISDKTVSLFNIDKNNLYSLQNPVVPDAPYMRDSLVYNLLSLGAKNSKFFDEFRMFDIGRVRKKNKIPAANNNAGMTSNDEKYASSFVGESGEIGMMIFKKDIKDRSNDPILDAKSFVDIILKELGINVKLVYEKTSNSSYHPNKQSDILYRVGKEKKKIGFVGALHPVILKSQKVSENAGLVYISLSLDMLLELISNIGEINYTYETLQDQIVYRDLCFVTDINKDFGEILDAVKAIKEIGDIEVFDLYKGTNLPEGKKSIAFKMKILGENMTTEQINEVMNKAIKAVEKVGATLRS